MVPAQQISLDVAVYIPYPYGVSFVQNYCPKITKGINDYFYIDNKVVTEGDGS